MSDSPDQRSLILYAIWMTALAVVALWATYLVRDAILLIYISGLLAVGFSPTVRLIERQKVLPVGTKRFPRWMAILILYLMILAAIVGIGLLVVPPLVTQARQLWTELPAMVTRASHFLVSKGLLDHDITWREAVQQAPVTVSGGSDAVGTVFGAVVGVVGGAFGLLTILLLTFYLLVEADQLAASMLRFIPRRRRASVAAASADITLKVSAWLVGQLILGGIISLTSAIGLWAMGIPFFSVLAVISGVGELIPVVGPVISAIPALAVAATVSYEKVVFVLIFFIVQQQLESNLLVPKIMERQVGVSAVTVIIALLVGGSLLGTLGAILAVPTAAILQVLFSELTGPDPKT